MTDGELLKYAIENGTINAALVQEKIEMQRRKELLEKHPFKIWEGSDGLWNTYLPDEDKGGIRKRKRTREELENFVRSSIAFHKLTAKSYSNLATLINGMFRYAKKNRYIILTDEIRELVQKIRNLNPNGEYLMERNGKRLTGTSFDSGIARICKKLGFNRKSMHKIRKTYGTMLIDGGVDKSLVAEQMGHADISCTEKYYYFSNKDVESKEKQIQAALSNKKVSELTGSGIDALSL